MARARFASLVTALSFIGSVATAQPSRDSIPTTARARYDTAFYAWQRGDYPTALAGFEHLLASADGDRVVERIALITGELYRTIDVASDGQAPQWSPHGRYASFTTTGGRVTNVIALDGDSVRAVASINGVGLVFSPDRFSRTGHRPHAHRHDAACRAHRCGARKRDRGSGGEQAGDGELGCGEGSGADR